jgi:hypothetical protein
MRRCGASPVARVPGGHNVRVTRRAAGPAVTAGLATVLALVLAGCGGGSGSSAPSAGGSGSGTSSSGGPSGGPSVSVVDGVTLTRQGTRLHVGQTARVSWQPGKKSAAVAAISVTHVQKMSISAFSDWRLDKATQRSTPYFVNATVRNLGKGDLAGMPVPLFLLDQHDTLLQASSFQAEFARCPSRPLPPKFTRGKKASVCLVYFAPDHGKLAAVSFRPAQDFDAITWSGPNPHPTPGPKPKTKHKKKH